MGSAQHTQDPYAFMDLFKMPRDSSMINLLLTSHNYTTTAPRKNFMNAMM